MSATDNFGDFSLFELFKEEIRAHTSTLSDRIVALESSGDDQALLNELMRAAHSLKGAARIVSLDEPVRIAHVLEDVFVAALEGKLQLQADHIDVLLEGVDFLAEYKDISEAELSDLTDRLKIRCPQVEERIKNILTGEKKPTPEIHEAVISAETPVVVEQPAPSPVVPRSQAASESSPAPASPPVNKGGEDKSLKVDTSTINRLLALAAEAQVDTQNLPDIYYSLRQLGQNLKNVKRDLNKIQEKLALGENVTGQLVELSRELDQLTTKTAQQTRDFDQFTRKTTLNAERLYREVMVSRMRPFSDGTGGFPRMVRDVARKLNKKVRIEITGQQTKVDRDILEKIDAPLNHIIRNALDHGLEGPDERMASGKKEEGLIKLDARHRSGMLYVTIADDGKGIDTLKVLEKAKEKGLVPEDMAGRLSKEEILDFLFLPGFSTSSEVTEISGRGVGLDVVRDILQSVGGNVHITTNPGQGTTFELTLPVARSIIRALIVTICNLPFAIPLSRISSLERVSRSALRKVGRVFSFKGSEGNEISLLPSSEILGMGGDEMQQKQLHVVAIEDKGSTYGIVVVTFHEERDLVVRPLDERLGKVRGISAASILDDGHPTLIVDVDDFLRSANQFISEGRFHTRAPFAMTKKVARKKRVLVADDSITVREVERTLLEQAGYEVDLAVDGMDAWNNLRLAQYDLLVTDVDMPRMNGFELVKKVRDDNRLSALPIIIVSYKNREEDKLKGMEAGADYYLTKSSFHDAKLLEAVANLIGGPQG